MLTFVIVEFIYLFILLLRYTVLGLKLTLIECMSLSDWSWK